MKRTPLALIPLLLVACACEKAVVKPNLADHALAATVQIEGVTGFGSGFFVAPGIVATAGHVGDDAYEIVTSTEEHCLVDASRIDYEKDVAILEVTCPGPTAIAEHADAHVGERIIAAGWPQRSSFVSTGDIAHVEDDQVKFTAPVTFGMSGGPVIDRDTGALVAIVTGFQSPAPLWSGVSLGTVASALEPLKRSGSAATDFCDANHCNPEV